jgi:large subunit ribosomal protein L30e
MKDIRSDMGTVLKTGKIMIGTESVVAGLLTASPKLVLVSGNCPSDVREKIIYYSQLSKIPLHVTKETSVELGSICGKPFPVSVFAVIDEGESSILGKFEKKH